MTMNSQKIPKKPSPKNRKNLLKSIFNHFLAVVLPLIGLLLSVLIGPPFTNTPLLIFIPIIVLCAWNGGFSAGILSSLTVSILVNYYFLGSHDLNTFLFPGRILQSLLIFIEGMFLSFILENGKNQEKIRDYKKRELELSKDLLELEEKNKKYEKEIRLRDEFLSVASHELKTPLTSMLLQTQSALHNIRNESVAHFSFENLLKMLESVENQTKRLSRMINDLLAVSVLTIGQLSLEHEEIDLGKLTKGVITDFQARIDKENVPIVFNAEEKVIGNWDKIRIEQAISNFISNAIKYGDHSKIEIDVSHQQKFATFVIKDIEIGIKKTNKKNILELFQNTIETE